MSIANTEQKTIIEEGIIDAGDQTRARIEHLKELEAKVGNPYPNKFERSRITEAEDTITNIVSFEPVAEIVRELKDNTPEGEKPNPELKEWLNAKLKEFGNVRVSGRLAVPPRVMGKAAFVHLSDGAARLQIYVRKQDAVAVSNDTGKEIEEEGAAWEVFSLLDHGDFIGVEGYLFLTNTGELSVHVEKLQFLSKALLPMPDKMHGIHDPEIRQRQRYADLIGSSLQIEHEGLTTREVFERRAKVISSMRRFLEDHGYIEVETPMLTPKATGAAAKPFETWHEALKIKLFARIAPELYLKRLVVGGFEKVYELNRNFRNEGISYKHNPEFTMLEFYCAYMDVNGMMDFGEELIRYAVQKATGSLKVNYEGKEIDFSKFNRISMKQSILDHLQKYYSEYKFLDFQVDSFDDKVKTIALSNWLNWYEASVNYVYLRKELAEDKESKISFHFMRDKESIQEHIKEGWILESQITGVTEGTESIYWDFHIERAKSLENSELNQEYSTALVKIFDVAVEPQLIQPTFIIDYPKIISPLSKASPENPQIAERFELFINGMECANGFSELNDPQEQYERFIEQMRERERGDEEAMVLDEDYIRALAYGMPPAAGIGIGIDRLVMLLTNRHSIRDVILFPHLRPERRDEEKKGEDENEAEASA